MEQTQTAEPAAKFTIQHHEKFELFNTAGGNYIQIEKFLERGNITPISISIAKLHGRFSTVSIGYVEDDTTRKYHLVTKSISAVGEELPYVKSELERLSSELEGIVCHDMTWDNGTYIVTFLTTK